jgi:hypothetical protein
VQFTSITDRTGELNNFFGRQALRGCLFAMLKACYNDTIFGLKPVVHSSFPFVRTSIEHLAKWHCLTFKSASKKPSKKRKKAAMPRSCVQHGRCLFPVFVPILLFA